MNETERQSEERSWETAKTVVTLRYIGLPNWTPAFAGEAQKEGSGALYPYPGRACGPVDAGPSPA